MSTYFCSDLHGEYQLLCKLLDKIGFCKTDTFYILGDIIDKGSDSLRLAELIRRFENMKAILGNHEYYFLQYYESCMCEYEGGDENRVLQKLQNYFPLDTFRLTWDLVDYIESLPYYIEGADFICVHAGLQLDKEKRVIPMQKQQYNYILFDRNFKEENVIPIDSKSVLFGHTPCNYQNGTGKFIKTPRANTDINSKNFKDYAKIQLDTGSYLTGMVGCLRKEDMHEFYVKR